MLLYVAPLMFLTLIIYLFALCRLFFSSLPCGFPLSLRPASSLAKSRRVTAVTGTDALWGVGHFGTSQPRSLRRLLRRMLLVPTNAFGHGCQSSPGSTRCADTCGTPRRARTTASGDETASSAACGSVDRDAVGMRARTPVVSAPPRPRADTSGAAARALPNADETEMLPREHHLAVLVLHAEGAHVRTVLLWDCRAREALV